MVHEHTLEGNDETDCGGGGGGDGQESVASKPLCTCNLSPQTQELLKEVFKDIVSTCTCTHSLIPGHIPNFFIVAY